MCLYNKDPEACVSSHVHLAALGWPDINDCSVCDLNEKLSFLHDVVNYRPTRENLVRVLSWLNVVFPSTCDIKKAKYVGVICPIADIDITTPCTVKSCSYNVNYGGALNCLLVYHKRSGQHPMKTGEIALVTGFSKKDVDHIYNKAFTLLRDGAIHSAQTDGDLPNQSFEFYATDGVCCVCESAILDKDEAIYAKIGGDTFAYCDQDCYEDKPPAIMALECRFGIDAEDIVVWASRRFKTISALEEALDVPKDVLVRFCERMPDFDASILPRRRSLTAKRTWHPPVWVDDVMVQTSNTLRSLTRKTGSDSSFRQRLQAVNRRLVRLAS